VNQPVVLDIPLLRVDDLVNIRIRAVNLKLDTETPGKGPGLVCADPDLDCLLVVRFPPQTIFEQAFLEEGSKEIEQPRGAKSPPLGPPSPTKLTPHGQPGHVACRMGAETRLVFRVPSDARIPYTVAGLLDWTEFQLAVSPIADVEAGMDPPPGALTIRPPTDRESTLQLPFRLHLSPTHTARWQHATEAVSHHGRAELWHTRIAADEKDPVALRAIWSPDYHPGEGGLNPLPTGLGEGVLAPMSINDRHQIVILTSAFTGWAASTSERYVPQPVQASFVMLSALGGWLRSFGHWTPPTAIKPPPWEDVVGQIGAGRVEKVRRREGLAELALDRILPRDGEPDPRPVARAQRQVDVAHDVAAVPDAIHADAQAPARVSPTARRTVDPAIWTALPIYELGDTTLEVSEWAHVAAQGRDHYVRIVYEGRLADTGHRASLVKVTERRFEKEKTDTGPVALLRQFYYIVVKEPERRYAANGSTRRGREMPLRTITLTTKVTPHIDFPYGAPSVITDRSFWVRVGGRDFQFTGTMRGADGRIGDFSKAMIFVPDSEANLSTVRAAMASLAGRERLRASVPGQQVAFADPGAGQNTVFATESFMLGDRVDQLKPAATDVARWRDALFEPTLLAATVHIPAAEALTGSSTPPTIALDGGFITDGFAAANNATGVFAAVKKLVDNGPGPVTVHDAVSAATFTAAKAGGVATPSLDITTLTRDHGPLGGTVDEAKANLFNAAGVFKDSTAALFGAFDLGTLLPTGGLTVGGNAPKMTVIRTGGTVVTSLTWKSTINGEHPFGLVSFVATPPTDVNVTVTITANANGTGSTDVKGTLTAFDVVFLDSLAVRFTSFSFGSVTGAKPTAAVELNGQMPFEFIGDLKFVEGLRSCIPPGMFGDGVSIDLIDNPVVGLRAGFAIGLPPAQVGVFGLKNISFSAGLTLPFTDGKPVVDLGFASRDAMFQLSVLIFGGGGFFHVELDTDGMRMLEAAFEFGATAALDIGVASGEVHIMAGIYFAMAKKVIPDHVEDVAALLSGYLRCGGSLSVLGLVRISVEFYLTFIYYGPPVEKAKGRATLTVEVEVGPFSKSIELTVEKSFGGKGSDPNFLDQFVTRELWAEYADAFA
jgi:hypothetical protein